MRITESQLRRIIRQEAKQLTEAAHGHGPKINYRRKAERLEKALDILSAIHADEEKHTGEADRDLLDVIKVVVDYLDAVKDLADRKK